MDAGRQLGELGADDLAAALRASIHERPDPPELSGAVAGATAYVAGSLQRSRILSTSSRTRRRASARSRPDIRSSS